MGVRRSVRRAEGRGDRDDRDRRRDSTDAQRELLQRDGADAGTAAQRGTTRVRRPHLLERGERQTRQWCLVRSVSCRHGPPREHSLRLQRLLRLRRCVLHQLARLSRLTLRHASTHHHGVSGRFRVLHTPHRSEFALRRLLTLRSPARDDDSVLASTVLPSSSVR